MPKDESQGGTPLDLTHGQVC